MADVFWAYWEASARFALLVSALVLLAPLLKRWLPARYICWAWALLLLRLVLPASVPVEGDLFSRYANFQTSAWTDSIRTSVVNSGLGETIIPQFPDQDARVLRTEIGFSWEQVLVTVWLLGVMVSVFCLGCNIRRLRRFFDRAELQRSGELFELFKDVRHRYGVHANVPLLVSDDVVTPGIAGIFNPKIILPRRCVAKLSDDEMRCVFVHELTHFRRGDLFVHHVLLLICYIHWFNPLAWFVLRSFRTSMEQACDAAVIDTACIGTARQYGYTILQVVQQAGQVRLANAGALCLLGNRKSSALKERIRLIARPRRQNGLLALLGLSLFGSVFALAVTGEADSKFEALRLMRLTRVASPFADLGRSRSVDSRNTLADLNALFSEYTRSWVASLDLTTIDEDTVVLDAQLRMRGGIKSTELWVWICDRSGGILSFQKLDGLKSVADRRRQKVRLQLDIPDQAYELCYGLFFSGRGHAWLDNVQMKTNEGSEELGAN